MKGCGLPGLERCSSEQRLASARPCVTRKHRNIPQAPQKKDGSRLLELSNIQFLFLFIFTAAFEDCGRSQTSTS